MFAVGHAFVRVSLVPGCHYVSVVLCVFVYRCVALCWRRLLCLDADEPRWVVFDKRERERRESGEERKRDELYRN